MAAVGGQKTRPERRRAHGAGEGFGHGGKLGSAHFFERADQPLGVTFAANGAEADRLFQRLHDEKFDAFYAKTPIDFGMTSQT